MILKSFRLWAKCIQKQLQLNVLTLLRIFRNDSSRRCSPRPSHSWRLEISVFWWRWPARYRRGPRHHPWHCHPPKMQAAGVVLHTYAEKSLPDPRENCIVDASFIQRCLALHVLLLANLLKVVSIQDWAQNNLHFNTNIHLVSSGQKNRWPENLIKCTTRVILHWCIRQRCNLPTLHQGMICNIYI